MFQIGDKVVHPMHGAGIIEDIVQREIDGKNEEYYALKVFDNIVLFLPIASCEKIGIRLVCSKEEAKNFLIKLEDIACSENKGWNQRYRENMLHIRSGDLAQVAQVIKNLAEREKERGLATGEKKMLSSARQILDSEIAYSLDISPEEAEELINEKLCLVK